MAGKPGTGGKDGTVTLRIEGITRRFGSVRAVDAVDLEVPPGSLLAVLGPSGCGKTTLLRMIAGLERPDAGSITWAGRPLGLGDSALVFQDAPLYPHLSVAQNVGFPLRLRAGRATAHPRRRVAEALELLRIGELSARRPHELSGGQRQRVGIARALARDVPVCLFDEPLAHLDESLAREILEDLRSVRRERGLTGVYVTHSSREAFALGDRVAVMASGRVRQTGTARQLWSRPADLFVAGFLGGRPLNRLAAGDAVLAVRPERVRCLPLGGAPSAADGQLGEAGLSCTAQVVEALPAGDRTELRLAARLPAGLRVEEELLRAEVPEAPGETAPEVGQTVRVRALPEDLLTFDAATGRLR